MLYFLFTNIFIIILSLNKLYVILDIYQGDDKLCLKKYIQMFLMNC